MTLQTFWVTQHWPRDVAGYVFLARAVGEVGRAIFGALWTDDEFKIEVPTLLPRLPVDRPGERAEARKLLETHRPEIGLAPLRSGKRHIPPVLPITEAQWKIAYEISRKLSDDVRPALLRKARVKEEITQRCAEGTTSSAYRPTEGGKFSPISASWWNTERAHNRFVMCQLNPRAPFGLGFSGDGFGWIFLTRDSLDRYLVSQPFARRPAGIDVHLSPYLQVMLSVARKLEITPSNQPKKEVVIEALREAWTRSPELSDNKIESMATLLREPESELGRARKRNSRPFRS